VALRCGIGWYWISLQIFLQSLGLCKLSGFSKQASAGEGKQKYLIGLISSIG
jgi:hypothetical protein